MPDRLGAAGEVDQALYRLQQPYGVSLPQAVQRLIAAGGAARAAGWRGGGPPVGGPGC